MSAETRDLVTWSLSTLISVTVLIGLATRYVLLPWLRQHLVVPMKQVEKQVTENHHNNRKPTVLDRIDDVQRDIADLATKVDSMDRIFAAHITWSDVEVGRIWKQIERERGEE